MRIVGHQDARALCPREDRGTQTPPTTPPTQRCSSARWIRGPLSMQRLGGAQPRAARRRRRGACSLGKT
eukprot:6745303-Pyramimonas_sp.AAC.1